MDHIEYGSKSKNTDIVLIQPVNEFELRGIENEISIIRSLSSCDFSLIAVKIEDWNRELSPWKAPAIFGNDDFGDGANETLSQILEHCRDRDKTYYLGGYSLAGLFALWAVYQTDIFSGVAAASPSVWFPGFDEYMKNGDIKTGMVYLSLGDKEEKVKNPVMALVGERIRGVAACLEKNGTDCILEWNQGNHFKEPDVRMAKAFAWLLNKR